MAALIGALAAVVLAASASTDFYGPPSDTDLWFRHPPLDYGWATIQTKAFGGLMGGWIGLQQAWPGSGEPDGTWIAVDADHGAGLMRWTSSRTCPALSEVVQSLETFRDTHVPQARRRPNFLPPIGGTTWTVSIAGPRGRYKTAAHNYDTPGRIPVASLVETIASELRPCWKDGEPPGWMPPPPVDWRKEREEMDRITDLGPSPPRRP